MLEVYFRRVWMRNYYDEILDKIQELMQDGRFDEAQALVLTELNMPYIPVEFEAKLKEMRLILKEQRNDGKVAELDEADIESYLFGSEEQQLIAVTQLSKQNLRMKLDLLRAYFLSNPSKSAVALLIDSLIEQSINEEFVYDKDGVEYAFNPQHVLRPFDSGGFQVAMSYLEEWFMHQEPSMFELCNQQLIFESFSFLPLSYNEDEGYELALYVTKIIYGLMNRLEEWDDFVQRAKPNEIPTTTHHFS